LLLGIRERYREDLAGRWKDDDVIVHLQQRLKLTFHRSSSVLPLGNSAVLEGLKQARILLETGTVDCCLVGGIDSFLQQADLEFLEESYRLLGGPIGQGLIPGEGAAFLVIALESQCSDAHTRGRILGIGTSTEADGATVLRGGYPTGRGLERAIEAALTDASLEEKAVEFRVSDLNGESYRGIESMLALSRVYRSRREHFEIMHPADCVGETGAAGGAILITAALTSLSKGYAPGKLAMCETSSDAGLRAACLVGM
jgi:3-oxoacyl-[acyl-carrier-protein] synthase-1